MKIYFDENFAHQIPQALDLLQKPCKKENIEVYSISNIFGRGATDEEWIPKVAEENGIVITQDLKIQYTKQQKELYKKYNLGVVFIKPPSKKGYTYWEHVTKIIISWHDIKEIALNQERPFSYVIRPRSSRLENI